MALNEQQKQKAKDKAVSFLEKSIFDLCLVLGVDQRSEEATIIPGEVARIARGAANGFNGAFPRRVSDPIWICFSFESECMKPSKSDSVKISVLDPFSARLMETKPPDAVNTTDVVALLKGDRAIRAARSCKIFKTVSGNIKPRNMHSAKMIQKRVPLIFILVSKETGT